MTAWSADAVKDKYSVAAGYRLIGDVRRHMGDKLGAVQAWQQGLAVLPTTTWERPREKAERADLTARIGNVAATRALENELRAMGVTNRG